MKVFLRLLSLPFIALIKIYQWVISPWLGPKCRFTPTCSHYAAEALKKHGLFKGFWLSLKRISKCHPWVCIDSLILLKLLQICQPHFSSQLHSRMQPGNQPCDSGTSGNKHVPTHLRQGSVCLLHRLHPSVDYPGWGWN